ncbi:hypothetical protein [Actinomadura sp. KC06]|uniref:hypothetical protein n=1 Tax=Actinomadura sp. KC06 TaxID=2530369 RepID=UPI001404C4FF|nr:hypothetical protein [Actinomadura sp. KC06]
MRGSALPLKMIGGDVADTPFRRVRMSDDMWGRFGEAVANAEPELDRSKVLREFVRWYIGETDDLPRRPAPKNGDTDTR